VVLLQFSDISWAYSAPALGISLNFNDSVAMPLKPTATQRFQLYRLRYVTTALSFKCEHEGF